MTPTIALLIAAAFLLLMPALALVVPQLSRRTAQAEERAPAHAQLGRQGPTYRTEARYVFHIHGRDGERLDVPIPHEQTARIDEFLQRHEQTTGDG